MTGSGKNIKNAFGKKIIFLYLPKTQLACIKKSSIPSEITRKSYAVKQLVTSGIKNTVTVDVFQ